MDEMIIDYKSCFLFVETQYYISCVLNIYTLLHFIYVYVHVVAITFI